MTRRFFPALPRWPRTTKALFDPRTVGKLVKQVLDPNLNPALHAFKATLTGAAEPAGDAEPAGTSPFPIKPGQFVKGSFANDAGSRSYKVYVPNSYRRFGGGMPLIVMLHGCTQSPDEFATASRMNELAEKDGFVVVYPGQIRSANAAKCWNWISPENQARDQGEPSIIAGITRAVASRLKIDRKRIFVAGHSAGAAMAVILGEAYPDLFNAIGVHSGLPFASAHDASSAFAAMKGTHKFGRIRVVGGPVPDVPVRPRATQAVPTIVFHGDVDPTVNALNGAAITEQALELASAHQNGAALRTRVETGEAAGRGFRRTVHADSLDRPLVEEWVIHGAGHAWSGGGGTNLRVSDPQGPNAAAEFVRFFLAQPGNPRA